MRHGLLMLTVALAGCAGTGVMEVGPNRYRITQEAYVASAQAEASVVKQAQDYCSARGQKAVIQITDARSAAGWSYATASGEFSCAPR